VDVISTLQSHIDTYLYKDVFGYLPPNLCMMGLAGQMNKHAHARVREVLPRVARRLAWHPDDTPPAMPEIQGFCSPRVYRTDLPRPRNASDGYQPRTPAWRYDNRDYGRPVTPGYERDGRGSAARHNDRLGPGQDGSRGRYTHPYHNRHHVRCLPTLRARSFHLRHVGYGVIHGALH
jgi:hypothetical protein